MRAPSVLQVLKKPKQHVESRAIFGAAELANAARVATAPLALGCSPISRGATEPLSSLQGPLSWPRGRPKGVHFAAFNTRVGKFLHDLPARLERMLGDRLLALATGRGAIVLVCAVRARPVAGSSDRPWAAMGCCTWLIRLC